MGTVQPVGLRRSISTVGQVGIALATISPVAGVFTNIQGALGTGGTGMMWAYVIAAVIALAVAFTYSEMGSIYPVTGGVYSIVRNVLGPSIGFLALTDYLIQAVIMPAILALGSAQFFQALMPSIPFHVLGFLVMLVVTLLALASTSLEAKVTSFFVVLEVILMTALTIASIAHIHQPLSIYSHPVVLANKHMVGSTWSMVIAATGIALFSYNGYDNALNVSEETRGSSKQIGSGVVKAAGLAIVFQFIPIFFMLLATPSIPGLLNSNDPLSVLGLSLFGRSASIVFNLAAGFAILNCTLGVTMQFSRILYASGRDGVWPSAMSRFFMRIHPRTGSPYMAVAVVGVMGLIMSFFSSFLFDLTFIGVILVVLYLLVTIAAVVSRIRDRNIERPYRAPLGFLFPVLGMVGAFVVLTQQTVGGLVTTALLFAIGWVYWLLFGRRFKVATAIDQAWHEDSAVEVELSRE